MSRTETLRLLVETSRPHYWPRAALTLVTAPGERTPSTAKTAAALSMLAASSAVYLFNDASDRERDRLHPEKRHRPVASGRLHPSTARGAAAMAAATALTLAGAGGRRNIAAVGAYLTVNAVYSHGGKQNPWFAMAATAAGVPLRIEAGNTTGRANPHSGPAFLLATTVAAAKQHSRLHNRTASTRTLSGRTLTAVGAAAAVGAARAAARRHGRLAGAVVAALAASATAAGAFGHLETIAWPARNPLTSARSADPSDQEPK